MVKMVEESDYIPTTVSAEGDSDGDESVTIISDTNQLGLADNGDPVITAPSTPESDTVCRSNIQVCQDECGPEENNASVGSSTVHKVVEHTEEFEEHKKLLPTRGDNTEIIPVSPSTETGIKASKTENPKPIEHVEKEDGINDDDDDDEGEEDNDDSTNSWTKCCVRIRKQKRKKSLWVYYQLLPLLIGTMLYLGILYYAINSEYRFIYNVCILLGTAILASAQLIFDPNNCYLRFTSDRWQCYAKYAFRVVTLLLPIACFVNLYCSLDYIMSDTVNDDEYLAIIGSPFFKLQLGISIIGSVFTSLRALLLGSSFLTLTPNEGSTNDQRRVKTIFKFIRHLHTVMVGMCLIMAIMRASFPITIPEQESISIEHTPDTDTDTSYVDDPQSMYIFKPIAKSTVDLEKKPTPPSSVEGVFVAPSSIILNCLVILKLLQCFCEFFREFHKQLLAYMHDLFQRGPLAARCNLICLLRGPWSKLFVVLPITISFLFICISVLGMINGINELGKLIPSGAKENVNLYENFAFGASDFPHESGAKYVLVLQVVVCFLALLASFLEFCSNGYLFVKYCRRSNGYYIPPAREDVEMAGLSVDAACGSINRLVHSATSVAA